MVLRHIFLPPHFLPDCEVISKSANEHQTNHVFRSILERYRVTIVQPLGLRELLCVLLIVNSVPKFAQFDDDDDFPPGVVARYSAGNKTIVRIDSDIAFVWEESAPDQRLPLGPFTANWKSQLLIKREGRYRFHAYLVGAIDVQLDGKTVLKATANKPGWVSGSEIELGFGEKLLDVSFQKTQPSARVQLYWSTDTFTLEPIPAFVFFRDGGNSKLAQIEQGRVQFRSHRCNRCHRRADDPISPAAPALSTVAHGTNFGWLVEKILKPKSGAKHARMPSFGFSKAEAESIATYLVSQSADAKLESLSKSKKEDRRQGEILLRSVGCLACHQMGEYGHKGSFAGGDLSRIAVKRSREWIYTWLAHPERLNPDHQMPVFKLNSTERRQLAIALSDDEASKEFKNTPSPNNALIKQGKKLVESARCAACHSIAKLKPKLTGIPDLSKSIENASDSCLAETPNRKTFRPAYGSIDHESIKAFLESRIGRLSPENGFARGQRVMEERNCLACHERGLSKGIVATAGMMSRVDSDLSGQSQGLIPPNLSAVGDKFLDNALATTVSGDQKSVRLPWLRVRMPRFKHDKADKSALLHYLQGHDRIPGGMPASISVPDKSKESKNQETLVIGHTLVGAKGFSCIACHTIGEYEPRNVALGTRGSDLMNLKGTMRKEYFLRWTRSPLRIVPGMEMPSYTKPVPGILAANVDAQLNAMWDALNDPRFKPPTNPSEVEQFLLVKPGERPRIVRDVFTNPKDNGDGYVARAFAVGLSNGHNMLFDLDTFALRQWTFGDFARQRTAGKSWYWDMAGVHLVSGFKGQSDFVLKQVAKGKRPQKFYLPKRTNGTVGRVLGYAQEESEVFLQYTIEFDTDAGPRTYGVLEAIVAIPADENTAGGWTRDIGVGQMKPRGKSVFRYFSPDYEILVARPIPKSTTGSPTIKVCAAGKRPVEYLNAKWQTIKGVPDSEFTQLDVYAPGLSLGPVSRRIELRYQSALKPNSLELKAIKPTQPPKAQTITSAPGFDGTQLPFAESIMPTAITWRADGTMAFASLKGHIYTADDSNEDGLDDRLIVFEEGLSAPYGIIAHEEDLIVSHKPELIRLSDRDGDGRADVRRVFATGWGFNDNYHDWVCGITRDSHGNMYVGLGSNYGQKDRPKEHSRWRGKVLRIDPSGKITPFGHAFRYPTGLAVDSQDRLFVSDNQGVQNTFNEINWVREDHHFGVPSYHERDIKVEPHRPAIQVPHPMTRSVNGLFFLPSDFAYQQLAGHGIGCEYNGRFLIRFTYQEVGDSIQGATYYFTKPNYANPNENFLGPLCGAVSPDGDLYIGSIHDSGWLGGRNTGSIVRLRPNGKLPNGIRELRATSDGFEIEFFSRVDPKAAALVENYSISGYTRVWQGSYTTADSGRYRVNVKSIDVINGGKSVRLHVDELKQQYVYDVSCSDIGTAEQPKLRPNTGHYTMNRIPHGKK